MEKNISKSAEAKICEEIHNKMLSWLPIIRYKKSDDDLLKLLTKEDKHLGDEIKKSLARFDISREVCDKSVKNLYNLLITEFMTKDNIEQETRRLETVQEKSGLDVLQIGLLIRKTELKFFLKRFLLVPVINLKSEDIPVISMIITEFIVENELLNLEGEHLDAFVMSIVEVMLM